MAIRSVKELIQATPTTDGDGVNLYRVFGGKGPERFDPFLMLDEFGSDNPNDYIAGFPPHPHRGFSTLTYMLQGHFEHKDNMGNVGGIRDGGVQWMTAGRGVIHSEMPKQTEGKLRGFQLWLNLPAKSKMMPAEYENIEAKGIAQNTIGNLAISAIAGEGKINDQVIKAYKNVPDTMPDYWDIRNMADQDEQVLIPQGDGRNALLYQVDGSSTIGEAKVSITAKQLVRLGQSGDVQFQLSPGARVLFLAGTPINEKIVQYGPFVMNSIEEIEQAIRDYQDGVLTEPA